MIDRTAILTVILKRNALRREALLPTLDVKAVYLKEVARAEWNEFVAKHGSQTRASVLKQQRERYGQSYPHSTGGRWAIELLTARALRARFQARQLKQRVRIRDISEESTCITN